MGNVESTGDATLQVCSDDSKSSTSTKKYLEPVNKYVFISKFDHSLSNLGERLWDASFQRESVSGEEFESFLSKFNEWSDKLRMFSTLACDNGINKKTLNELLQWLKFGQTFSKNLEVAIFGSLFSSLSSIITIDDVVSRLVLFQDTADDLTRLVLHTVNSPTSITVDFTVASGFSTLFTPGLLWLLSNLLSAPFKKLGHTRLTNSAPLEIEQLQHLQQLFDSTVHGFSYTRIKELAFDYDGPLILLFRADKLFFCLASDQGLKDSLKTYGGVESKLFKIEPDFVKLVSGRSSKLAGPGAETGIIYSNFTMKTARRGLLVGHQPLVSAAVEINEGFTELRYTGSLPIKLTHIEIWAAGSPEKLTQLQIQKAWELTQVNKEKNRKFKLEDWRESADRQLLSMAGRNVNYSDQVGVLNNSQADRD